MNDGIIKIVASKQAINYSMSSSCPFQNLGDSSSGKQFEHIAMHKADVLIKLPGIVSGNRSSIIRLLFESVPLGV